MISESHISMTDQTGLPFTFQFRDIHVKTRSTFDFQIVASRLLGAMEELLPFDSLSSYETLKPCILNVLLNVNLNFVCIYLIENLQEQITITACDTFRANQVKWVKTLVFIVDIEFQMVEECKEDKNTTVREIIEATMEVGSSMGPTSKDSIKKMLNTRRFEKKEIGEICVVCQEEFLVGLKVKVMSCGHVFLGDCIIKCLEQSHFFCPLCCFSMSVDAN
ncbi:hypothetical protein NE237_018833 [Protea cynaroides]|uniref:RING-type domain-containing protein n=1 Tax=Protea cynaroides TaxID=273540 RepID=A0A9Q0KAR1_9MAGN|nr:hypothetical protein NE237_018833 [Protea cynaroides]